MWAALIHILQGMSSEVMVRSRYQKNPPQTMGGIRKNKRKNNMKPSPLSSSLSLVSPSRSMKETEASDPPWNSPTSLPLQTQKKHKHRPSSVGGVKEKEIRDEVGVNEKVASNTQPQRANLTLCCAVLGWSGSGSGSVVGSFRLMLLLFCCLSSAPLYPFYQSMLSPSTTSTIQSLHLSFTPIIPSVSLVKGLLRFRHCSITTFINILLVKATIHAIQYHT